MKYYNYREKKLKPMPEARRAMMVEVSEFLPNWVSSFKLSSSVSAGTSTKGARVPCRGYEWL